MSRSARLLDLLQVLRRHRRPVTAAALAGELGVSERTIYRDVATLSVQGAPIEGEAGLGYVLRPGYLLPPLMFREEEIEALVLGLRWVAGRGDAALSLAAADALARITAVLPADARDAIPHAGLIAAPSEATPPQPADLSVLRRAMREERKLRIAYTDAAGHRTDRLVWPCALGFFDQVRILAAWCEIRLDFRHFRVDRIQRAEMAEERYPRRRRVLLAEWRAREGVPEGF